MLLTFSRRGSFLFCRQNYNTARVGSTRTAPDSAAVSQTIQPASRRNVCDCVLPNLADSFPCLGEGRLVGNYANNDEPHTIKGGKGAAHVHTTICDAGACAVDRGISPTYHLSPQTLYWCIYSHILSISVSFLEVTSLPTRARYASR